MMVMFARCEGCEEKDNEEEKDVKKRRKRRIDQWEGGPLMRVCQTGAKQR